LILGGIVIVAWTGLVGATGSDKKEQPKVELSKEEQRILELTNEERAKKKLAPLRVQPILCRVARAYSDDMAKQGKMQHELDGKTHRQRVTEAGYKNSGAGENLGRSNISPEAVVKGWMESKGHRETLLDPDYTETGIGVVDDGKGVLYYTQLFGIPKEKAGEGKKKPAGKLSPEEQKILDLTNEARKKVKLAPLKINFTLIIAARGHSRNMAKQRKMDHKLNGKGPAERIKDAGYRAAYYGENIAFGFGEFGAPEKIFQGWMDSKGHRKNILTATFREIGIGTYTNDAGEMFYTQVFGTPR
jgi:uncharacterized protein YkwD